VYKVEAEKVKNYALKILYSQGNWGYDINVERIVYEMTDFNHSRFMDFVELYPQYIDLERNKSFIEDSFTMFHTFRRVKMYY
jgi:hypothetical protein